MSSRAVLMVGGLTLLCLSMAAAMAFQTDPAEAPPSLDAVPAMEATPVADASAEEATDPSTLPGAPTPAVGTAEATPVSADTLPDLEQAGNGPLQGELAQLLTAIQYGFGAQSAELEPTLRPYVAHVVGRLNVHPGPFGVTVSAPDAAMAERRAEVLRAAFAAAGLPPERLPFTPVTGPPALTLTP